MGLGFDRRTDRPEQPATHELLRGCVSEFFAMTLFVYFGCGGASSNVQKNLRTVVLGNGTLIQSLEWDPAAVTIISLQFGLGITTLAYFCAHSSGGHINCAVTWALVLVGQCHPVKGFCYFLSQMCGSIAGAALLKTSTMSGTSINPADRTGGLGSNGLQTPYITEGMAIVGEIMGTFLLVIVVLETAKNGASAVANKGWQASLAPIPIGLAVFLAHVHLIPITGCSINPTRSFGPSLVAGSWANHWIWWVGPLAGATLASGVWSLLHLPAIYPDPDQPASNTKLVAAEPRDSFDAETELVSASVTEAENFDVETDQ